MARGSTTSESCQYLEVQQGLDQFSHLYRHGHPSSNPASDLHAASAIVGSAFSAPVRLERRAAVGATLERPGAARDTPDAIAEYSAGSSLSRRDRLAAVAHADQRFAATHGHRRTTAADNLADPAGCVAAGHRAERRPAVYSAVETGDADYSDQLSLPRGSAFSSLLDSCHCGQWRVSSATKCSLWVGSSR
jgi:hypothetical protein